MARKPPVTLALSAVLQIEVEHHFFLPACKPATGDYFRLSGSEIVALIDSVSSPTFSGILEANRLSMPSKSFRTLPTGKTSDRISSSFLTALRKEAGSPTLTTALN